MKKRAAIALAKIYFMDGSTKLLVIPELEPPYTNVSVKSRLISSLPTGVSERIEKVDVKVFPEAIGMQPAQDQRGLAFPNAEASRNKIGGKKMKKKAQSTSEIAQVVYDVLTEGGVSTSYDEVEGAVGDLSEEDFEDLLNAVFDEDNDAIVRIVRISKRRTKTAQFKPGDRVVGTESDIEGVIVREIDEEDPEFTKFLKQYKKDYGISFFGTHPSPRYPFYVVETVGGYQEIMASDEMSTTSKRKTKTALRDEDTGIPIRNEKPTGTLTFQTNVESDYSKEDWVEKGEVPYGDDVAATPVPKEAWASKKTGYYEVTYSDGHYDIFYESDFKSVQEVKDYLEKVGVEYDDIIVHASKQKKTAQDIASLKKMIEDIVDSGEIDEDILVPLVDCKTEEEIEDLLERYSLFSPALYRNRQSKQKKTAEWNIDQKEFAKWLTETKGVDQGDWSGLSNEDKINLGKEFQSITKKSSTKKAQYEEGTEAVAKTELWYAYVKKYWQDDVMPKEEIEEYSREELEDKRLVARKGETVVWDNEEKMWQTETGLYDIDSELLKIRKRTASKKTAQDYPEYFHDVDGDSFIYELRGSGLDEEIEKCFALHGLDLFEAGECVFDRADEILEQVKVTCGNTLYQKVLREVMPKMSSSSLSKQSYVRQVPGHKNSKGESAPWCIFDHKSGKLLSSHKSEKAAKDHLQQMYIHKSYIKQKEVLASYLSEADPDYVLRRIIKKVPGHTNRTGEEMPWCIVNRSDRILSCHKTKGEAIQHRQEVYLHERFGKSEKSAHYKLSSDVELPTNSTPENIKLAKGTKLTVTNIKPRGVWARVENAKFASSKGVESFDGEVYLTYDEISKLAVQGNFVEWGVVSSEFKVGWVREDVDSEYPYTVALIGIYKNKIGIVIPEIPTDEYGEGSLPTKIVVNDIQETDSGYVLQVSYGFEVGARMDWTEERFETEIPLEKDYSPDMLEEMIKTAKQKKTAATDDPSNIYPESNPDLSLPGEDASLQGKPSEVILFLDGKTTSQLRTMVYDLSATSTIPLSFDLWRVKMMERDELRRIIYQEIANRSGLVVPKDLNYKVPQSVKHSSLSDDAKRIIEAALQYKVFDRKDPEDEIVREALRNDINDVVEAAIRESDMDKEIPLGEAEVQEPEAEVVEKLDWRKKKPIGLDIPKMQDEISEVAGQHIEHLRETKKQIDQIKDKAKIIKKKAQDAVKSIEEKGGRAGKEQKILDETNTLINYLEGSNLSGKILRYEDLFVSLQKKMSSFEMLPSEGDRLNFVLEKIREFGGIVEEEIISALDEFVGKETKVEQSLGKTLSVWPIPEKFKESSVKKAQLDIDFQEIIGLFNDADIIARDLEHEILAL